jgi:cytochrome c-type biogenesis protein CcsB
MTLLHLEGLLLWAAVAAYAATIGFALVGALFKKEGARRWGALLPVLGLAAHTAAIVVRWIATGHAPVQGAYENSLAGAWFLLPLAWAIARGYPPARRFVPLVVGAVLLLLGNGIMAPAEHAPLEPPYRSAWLGVHVTFAWLALGSYLVASLLAGQYLWTTRRAGSAGAARSGAADELAARLIAFGFVSHTVMIASGAIWARGLWGRYWAWDPIETWSLVSWLVYAVALHLRFTLGWAGRRAAWVAMASVAAIVITFFGIGVISNVHTQLL